jgi:hypothetical protein
MGVLLVALINLHDEDLTPEAKKLAQFHPAPVPDHQNAFLALAGFDAPEGSDPIVVGAKIVSDHREAARRDPTGVARADATANVSSTEPGDGRLRFLGDRSTLCDPIGKPCLQSLGNDAERLRTLLSANAELIRRYLALQKLPAFANTSLPDPLQPMPAGGWGDARRLLVTQAALDAQSGQADRALEFLAADMALWRRVLASGSGMIEEMIAVRMLASDVALLSELIALPSFDAARYQAALRTLLAPLTPDERNAAPMLDREYAMSSKMLSEIHSQSMRSEDNSWLDSVWARLLFKKNASLNEFAGFFTELGNLARQPPTEYAGLRDKLLNGQATLSEPGVTWAYNPVGKLLARIAVPPYPEYIARVFDLAAYVQLVRAQLEVRLASLDSDKVPTFLAGASASTLNPYDNKPFAWDSGSRSLTFVPMNPRPWKDWQFKATVPRP